MESAGKSKFYSLHLAFFIHGNLSYGGIIAYVYGGIFWFQMVYWFPKWN